jgi:hypothetical protein
VLKEFALKEKKEDSSKNIIILLINIIYILVIYQAIYVSNVESMSGLEVIKSDDLYSGGE